MAFIRAAIIGVVISCSSVGDPIYSLAAGADPRGLFVAVAQPLVVPGDIDGNIDRMAPLVAEAVRRGAELVVTSECGICGYDLEGVGAAAAIPADSPALDRVAALARDHDVVVVAGLYERDGDAIHNSAIAFYPNGVRVLQRKHNIAPAEAKFTRPGPRQRVLFNVRGFTCGILICSDSSIDGIHEEVARDGCDVVLSMTAGGGSESIALHQSEVETPEARARYAEEIARCLPTDAIRRAMDLDMAIVACNQSGWVPETRYYHGGGSWIIDRTGRIAAVIPYRKVLEHVGPDLAVGTVSRRTHGRR